jgi:4-amino-4-deoxy-L-arabinose transferase-like glycosyltransferase
VLVVAATLLYLAVVLVVGARVGNESADLDLYYEPVARSLLDGDGFHDPRGGPAVRYPPGFPVLLAVPLGVADATGLPSDRLVEVLVAVAMGLSCGVVHRIGRRLLGEPAAVLGAVLWMLWPLNLWLAKQPNSEVPFDLLLLLGVLATVRAARGPDGAVARDVALAGLALGAAALVRPAGLVLALPVAAWLWWDRRASSSGGPAPWKAATLLVVVAGLVVVPWVVWASAASDRVIPLSDGGRDTVVDGIEVGIGQKGTEEGRTVPMTDGLRDLLEDLSAQDSDGDLRTTGDVVGAVVAEVPERPGAVAQLVAFKATRSWYGTESLRYEAPLAVVQLATAALLVVGGVRCWRAGGGRRRALGLLLAVLSTSWVLTMAVISLVRYLTPALGLALLLGGVALEPLVARRRQTRDAAESPAVG